ncbi:hypothetical protein Tco_0059261 [Tanacetum coccineum]
MADKVTIKRPRDGADDDSRTLPLEQTEVPEKEGDQDEQAEESPTYFLIGFKNLRDSPSPDHAWNTSVPAVA